MNVAQARRTRPKAIRPWLHSLRSPELWHQPCSVHEYCDANPLSRPGLRLIGRAPHVVNRTAEAGLAKHDANKRVCYADRITPAA